MKKTKKIVIIPDSFKGCLSAAEVSQAISQGIHMVHPEYETVCLTAADGGEGTVDVLVDGLGGIRIACTVTGPLGTPVEAYYGYLPNEKTVVLEIAQSAGLPLVPEILRDPMETTTLGVGEMILHALDRGYRNFLIGLGGSATNDCGIGMLSALGMRFLNEDKEAVKGYGKEVETIVSFDPSGLDERLADCRFLIASDVTNPLYGPMGASFIFAPQKGASAETVRRMDAAHQTFAALILAGKKAVCSQGEQKMDLSWASGAGAAGGLGFAFMEFLHGEMRSGINLVLELIGFEQKLEGADLLITGEGCFDEQSLMGKVVGEVYKRAKDHGVPLAVICGCASDSMLECQDPPVYAVHYKPFDPEEALNPDNARAGIRQTAADFVRFV